MKSRVCLGMLIGIGVGALNGCQSGESSDDAAPLASVGEKTLSVEQLQQRIPPGMDPEDSIAIANQYIDQWIREQIFIQQAEQSLSDETVDFEDEVEAYRNALVLHEYKNRFVNKQLNTNVSEEEALNYYQENQQSFVLTDYRFRALFIDAPSESELTGVRELFTLLDSTRFFEMEQWCVENGARYALAGTNWWSLSEFTKEVPMDFYRVENQLSSRRLIEFEAENRVYLVRFLEHAFKDEVAPFAAVQQEVEELILHQRRQQLLQNLEEQLVVKAWAEGIVFRAE
ncbi:MAG: hypothetical protein ACO2XQ_08950 [Flavobacteriales bacterium]